MIKKNRVVLGILLFLSSSLMAQQWTLDNCLAYAMENNKNLLAQKQNQTITTIDKKSAWAHLAPEIDLNASMDYYWQIPIQTFPAELVGGEEGSFVAIPTGTPWMGNYGLQARMKLIDVEAWQNIKLCALKQQAAQSEFLSLKKVLSRNVNMSFHIVQQQQENENVAHERYINYTEIHRLITIQFNKGLTDKISFNQSVNLLKEQEENYIKANSSSQNALLSLKFWMGYPLNDSLSIDSDSKIFHSNMALSQYDEFLLPDYDFQKSKVIIAKQQYKSVASTFYPTLSFRSGYGQSGFGEKIGQSEWYTSGFIGVELHIPIFSLTKAYSPKRLKVLQKQAEYEFSTYQEIQKKEYLQKIVLLNEAFKSLQIQRENLELAKENEQLSKQKIEKGIIDMVQLKQIQQDLTRSQESLNSAQLNYLKQIVELNYLQNENSQN